MVIAQLHAAACQNDIHAPHTETSAEQVAVPLVILFLSWRNSLVLSTQETCF